MHYPAPVGTALIIMLSMATKTSDDSSNITRTWNDRVENVNEILSQFKQMYCINQTATPT